MTRTIVCQWKESLIELGIKARGRGGWGEDLRFICYTFTRHMKNFQIGIKRLVCGGECIECFGF